MTVGQGDDAAWWAKLNGLPVAPPAALPFDFYQYGHSYTMDGVQCTVGLEAYRLLGKRLGLRSVESHGVSGDHMVGLAGRLLGTATPWPAGRRGIVHLDCAAGDWTNLQVWPDVAPITPGGVACFRESLRTCLALLSSGARYELAPSGSWPGSAAASFSGGANVYSNAQNVGLDTEVVVPESGRLWAITAAVAGTGDLQLVVEADGVAVDVPASSFEMAGGIGYGVGFYPVAVELAGLTPGPATVTAIKTDPGAGFVSMDVYLAETLTPPLVLVSKDPMHHPEAAGANEVITTPGHAAILAANRELVHAALEAECALWPNVVVVEPQVDASGLGPDGVHPNDRGMHIIAEALASAIAAAGDLDGMYVTL